MKSISLPDTRSWEKFDAERKLGKHGWVPTRIVAVEDTRPVEEQGDKFVRLTGQGTSRACDRCSKVHEVHVTVEGDDGHTHVVGTGCAHATGPLAEKLKSAVSAVKTLGTLQAQLAAKESYKARHANAQVEVSALPYPGHRIEQDTSVIGKARTGRGEDALRFIPHDTAHTGTLSWGTFTEEQAAGDPAKRRAREELIASGHKAMEEGWRKAQLEARVPTEYHDDDLVKRIAKAEAKIAAATGGESARSAMGALFLDHELEYRNWEAWHLKHPYLAHPREKNETPDHYAERLKSLWATHSKTTYKGLTHGDRIIVPGREHEGFHEVTSMHGGEGRERTVGLADGSKATFSASSKLTRQRPHADQVEMKGPGWTAHAEAEARAGIAAVHRAFPRAPHLNHVKVSPDQSALGNKGRSHISVSPMFIDRDAMAKRDKEASGLLITGGERVIVMHEYGHILDGDMLKHHPEQYQKLDELLDSPVTWPDGSVHKLHKDGMSMPTPYAGDNRYELVAEGLADHLMNGDEAHPTSKKIAAIFHEAYGTPTQVAVKSVSLPNTGIPEH